VKKKNEESMHVDFEASNSTIQISDHFNDRLNTLSPNTYYVPGVIFMVCVIGLLLYANFFYEYNLKDAWTIIISKNLIAFNYKIEIIIFFQITKFVVVYYF
jgi:hypothetical protein